jgi:hypothetical protein
MWTCVHCTTINKPGHLKCLACAKNRDDLPEKRESFKASIAEELILVQEALGELTPGSQVVLFTGKATYRRTWKAEIVGINNDGTYDVRKRGCLHDIVNVTRKDIELPQALLGWGRNTVKMGDTVVSGTSQVLIVKRSHYSYSGGVQLRKRWTPE